MTISSSTFFFLFLFDFSTFIVLDPIAIIQGEHIFYETSPRGNPILVLDFNRYVKNRESKKTVFWRCARYYQNQVNCPGSVAISKPNNLGVMQMSTKRHHNDVCELKRQQKREIAKLDDVKPSTMNKK